MSFAIRDLRARRAHHIGHRALADGEVLCRLQFRSADDAKFFGNHLRWSAFEMVAVDEPAIPATAPAPVPAKPKTGKDKMATDSTPVPSVQVIP